MAARRRRPLLCRHCKAPVRWLIWSASGTWRLFDAKPVDGRAHSGPPAYPVENGRTAWRLSALVEDLQARRQASAEDARDEAYDMPWHTPHACREAPDHATEHP